MLILNFGINEHWKKGESGNLNLKNVIFHFNCHYNTNKQAYPRISCLQIL